MIPCALLTCSSYFSTKLTKLTKLIYFRGVRNIEKKISKEDIYSSCQQLRSPNVKSSKSNVLLRRSFGYSTFRWQHAKRFYIRPCQCACPASCVREKKRKIDKANAHALTRDQSDHRRRQNLYPLTFDRYCILMNKMKKHSLFVALHFSR